jgi:hypothetical protein
VTALTRFDVSSIPNAKIIPMPGRLFEFKYLEYFPMRSFYSALQEEQKNGGQKERRHL